MTGGRWLGVTGMLVGIVMAAPIRWLGAQVAPRRTLDFRLDAIGARAPGMQLGVGAGVPAGAYVRLEGLVAGGAAWSRGEARTAARIDAIGRFLLDPLQQARSALYGTGGVGAMYDGFESWRARLVVGGGFEWRGARGRTTSLEIALGGGVRVGIVARR